MISSLNDSPGHLPALASCYTTEVGIGNGPLGIAPFDLQSALFSALFLSFNTSCTNLFGVTTILANNLRSKYIDQVNQRSIVGTRARIAFTDRSAKVFTSAYHHWDGYPSWLGAKLQEHYGNRVKATELVAGGDMSSCWTNKRWQKTGSEIEVSDYGPQYYSDRGEIADAEVCLGLQKLLELCEETDAEYLYVYKPYSGWKCYNTKQGGSRFGQTEPLPTV